MTVIPDWTLFVQMGNFILLIFILNAILYKPIRQILIERKKKIQGYKEGIETLQQDASESEKSFQANISEARQQGVREKEALKQTGQEEEKPMKSTGRPRQNWKQCALRLSKTPRMHDADWKKR